MTPTPCAFDGCGRACGTRQRLCHGHCTQKKRGLPLAPITPNRRKADVVEDVEWIIGTDSAERIAERVGLTLEALERALYRADRRDLWHRIKAGMPANLHTSTKAA